jgi:hypothetical protein
VHGRKGHRGGRGLLVLAAVFGATLLAGSGQAYAQTEPPPPPPGGSGGVDQYVEDVPTAGGSHVPGKGPTRPAPIKPSVQTQIVAQGGVDAPALTKIATSPDYGAGEKLTPQTVKPGARGEDVSSASSGDVSSTAAAASAMSAVQGTGIARLVGFLLVLFGISVATLTAAATRQQRA